MKAKAITKAPNSNQSWWRGIYILAFCGFILRLMVALISDHIYFPDELFQLLEQAHRVVFGYGFIPWEFRFGTRSWIPPGFITIILFICKFLQLDQPSLYIPIVKGVFCLLSVSLIFSSYVIGRSLVSENAGRWAAFFVTCWYELIYFSHKPLTEVIATYIFVAALAVLVSTSSGRRAVLFGILSALCVVFRLQFAPLVFFLLVIAYWTWEKNALLKTCLSFAAVLACAGLVDYWTWDMPFISFYNNILFNVIYGVSSGLFGASPFYWYITALTFSSLGLFIILLVMGFVKFRILWIITVCVLIVLLSHSVLSHKEYRFIFAVVPLLLMIMGIQVSETLLPRVSAGRRNLCACAVVVLFCLLSLAGLFRLLPGQHHIYHKPPLFRDPTLGIYKELSGEPNITAILDLSRHHPFSAGGYYYLHRDVPIYYDVYTRRHWLNTGDPVDYASHIISSKRRVASGGRDGQKVSIDMRPPNLPPPLRDDTYTKHILQPGIDDVYKP